MKILYNGSPIFLYFWLWQAGTGPNVADVGNVVHARTLSAISSNHPRLFLSHSFMSSTLLLTLLCLSSFYTPVQTLLLMGGFLIIRNERYSRPEWTSLAPNNNDKNISDCSITLKIRWFYIGRNKIYYNRHHHQICHFRSNTPKIGTPGSTNAR